MQSDICFFASHNLEIQKHKHTHTKHIIWGKHGESVLIGDTCLWESIRIRKKILGAINDFNKEERMEKGSRHNWWWGWQL